jgi:REP element-mobilizing transposase RayT
MTSSLTTVNIHYVFSTKNRQKLLDKSFRDRLWAYMGGIARQNKMIAQAIGGTEDHVHLLITLPPMMSTAKGIQLIKAGSSKWIHEEFPELSDFSWQTGYGAFSVSINKLPVIKNYIHRQEEHHRKKSYEEEYLFFLKESGIEYDEKYVLG